MGGLKNRRLSGECSIIWEVVVCIDTWRPGSYNLMCSGSFLVLLQICRYGDRVDRAIWWACPLEECVRQRICRERLRRHAMVRLTPDDQDQSPKEYHRPHESYCCTCHRPCRGNDVRCWSGPDCRFTGAGRRPLHCCTGNRSGYCGRCSTSRCTGRSGEDCRDRI